MCFKTGEIKEIDEAYLYGWRYLYLELSLWIVTPGYYSLRFNFDYHDTSYSD